MLEISSRITTLLKITNFLELTTCLAIFSCLDTEYFNNLVSLSLLVHTPNILTYSRDFSGFSLSLLTGKKGVKSVDISGSWLNSTYVKRAYTKGICTGDIYAKDVCIRVTYDKGACIKGAGIESTGIESAGIKNICVRGTCIRGNSTIGAYIGAGTYSNGVCTRLADIKSTYIRVPCTKSAPIEGTCIKDIYAWSLGTCIDNVDTIACSKMHLQSSLILKVGWYGIRLETVVGTTCFKSVCVNTSFQSLEVGDVGLDI